MAHTVICQFCHEGCYADECKEFALDYACADCSTLCPYCEDWLCNEPDEVIGALRFHKTCADELRALPTLTISPLELLNLADYSDQIAGAA